MNPFAGPQQKTWSVVGAGSLTTILVWILKQAWNIDMPADVAAAVTTVLTVVASAVTAHYQDCPPPAPPAGGTL